MTFETAAMTAPVRYMRRAVAARYIQTTYGFSCSPQWLAKLAVVGGGPVYRKAGRTPLYRHGVFRMVGLHPTAQIVCLAGEGFFDFFRGDAALELGLVDMASGRAPRQTGGQGFSWLGRPELLDVLVPHHDP